MKIRFPPKTGWLDAKVSAVLKGSKWSGADTEDARWWLVEVTCDDGQSVVASHTALNGRGKSSGSTLLKLGPLLKLVPLAQDDPRLAKESAEKAAQNAANEAKWEAQSEQRELERHWWQANEGKLTWLYLHEPPTRFQPAFLNAEYQHHLLAYLQTAEWESIRKQVTVQSLNMIHGESCKHLFESHHRAVACLTSKRTSRFGKEKWDSMVHDMTSYQVLNK